MSHVKKSLISHASISALATIDRNLFDTFAAFAMSGAKVAKRFLWRDSKQNKNK